tara:strand:+ start:125 stop:322 length:198 start_codon:yes stop_codon:yes gene_type:complete
MLVETVVIVLTTLVLVAVVELVLVVPVILVMKAVLVVLVNLSQHLHTHFIHHSFLVRCNLLLDPL